MNTTSKMRDLTLKNMIILVSYVVFLILCLVNFDHIINFIGLSIDIITPFFIGFVLAFIFNLPMKYFITKLPIKNEKKKKMIAATLAVFLVTLIILLLIMVVLPQLIENLGTLINNLPETFSQVEKWLSYFLKEINIPPSMMNTIESFQKSITQAIITTLSQLVPNIAQALTSFASSLITIAMGFVIAIYMLFSKDKLLRQVKKMSRALLDDAQYEKALDITHLTSSTFENFMTGQLTESVIIGILCYIGCIALGIPYASIAAVIIGFTNIIPYFGPIIGACISSVLIVFVSPVKALVFIIFSSLLQQFESNIIYPHVVGNSVGLSALWVLFAVVAGGGLFGIPGMIFGLPTFSVIYELVRRWTNNRLALKNIQQDI